MLELDTYKPYNIWPKERAWPETPQGSAYNSNARKSETQQVAFARDTLAHISMPALGIVAILQAVNSSLEPSFPILVVLLPQIVLNAYRLCMPFACCFMCLEEILITY